MIAAHDGEAVEVFRVRNAAASPLRYEMDPMEQHRAWTSIEDSGRELAAIYHSHTRTPPVPSPTDVNLSEMWPDPLYVIIGVGNPEEPIVRAWRITDGQYTEAPLEVG